MNALLKIFALASGVLATIPPAFGEEMLKLVTQLPSNDSTNTQFLHPWADRVNEQGKGIVHIQVYDGNTLAGPRNFYDRIQDDVIQVTWGGLESGAPGRFPLSDVVSLPFEASNSELSSVTFQRLYESGLLDAEFKEIKPLFVYVYPQSRLHLRARPPAELTTLRGLKIISLTKGNGNALQALGAAPISLMSNETYQALQTGVADGVLIPWPAFEPFKLAEVTVYHLDAAFGAAPGVFLMARKKYESLSAEARKILDANSGEFESRRWGKLFDETEERERQKARAAGQVVRDVPNDVRADWEKSLAPLTAEWEEKTPNGSTVLRKWRELLAQVTAQH